MWWNILIIDPDRGYSEDVIKRTADLDIMFDVVGTVEEAGLYLDDSWVDVVLLKGEDNDGRLIETIRILKSAKSSPAIFITGDSLPERTEKLIQSGVFACLSTDSFLMDFRKHLKTIWKNKEIDKRIKKQVKEFQQKITDAIPKIIIVDDSPILRKITKRMLPDNEYQVLTAEDGSDCLKKLEFFQADIVLSDIVMDGINGIELCKRLKESSYYKNIPVLLMSTESEIGRKINGFNVGAADYLIKPFEAEELKARIASHFLQKKLIEDLKLENSKRKDAEESLREYSNKLEDIVAERTREIKASNVLLKNEIKDREKIQSDLEKNQKKYRDLVETINEWIWEVDADGFFSYNSPKAFDVTGYTLEELIGKQPFDLLAPEDVQNLKNEFSLNESELKNVKSFEHIYQHKNKSLRTIESGWVPFFDENNCFKGYRGVSRDITDLKKSKDEKANLERQLIQVEKMASIGQLAAGVAHEINNPIGFVNSNLHTLTDYIDDINRLLPEYRDLVKNLSKDDYKDKLNSGDAEILMDINKRAEELDIDFILSDAGELIGDCREGVERIKKIVSSLKDFAHPGVEKNCFADINSNIDSTLAIVWNELKYKTTIVKEYGDIPDVYCNIQQLNQVFMNFLVNAAHAIETHGTITIATRSLGDHSVEIRISDTGKGIPDKIKTRIFDPFFTTKEVGKGTGLGLNLSYNIIAKHGGTIELESEVGNGTIFIIRLPVNASDVAEAQKNNS